MRITSSVHRVGDDNVGCYVIEEAGLVTVVDAGMSGQYGQLFDELAAMGRTIDDVRALVLTHGHEDHIGFAERLRSSDGVSVKVHELDAALARGEVPNPSPGLGERKLVPLLSFLLYGLRRGGLRTRHLTVVETFTGGTTLDVPGALEVIHTPGHTPGNCALLAPGHDVLFAGDTLATRAVTSGRVGPQIAPFTADPEEALGSLAAIEGLEVSWVLPGHGAPWSGGAAAAVAEARKTGVAHLAPARGGRT